MFLLAVPFVVLMTLVFPWWMTALASLVLGYFYFDRVSYLLKIALAFGCAWALGAWVLDQTGSGMVAHRMAGVFGLGFVPAIFAIQFLIGFLTSSLWSLSGCGIRHMLKSSTK